MVSTVDNQIIEILKQNSRASFADIGRQIALSASSVRERVQKLEDLGVIKSYNIKLNHVMLGCGLEVFVMLKIFDGKLKCIS